MNVRQLKKQRLEEQFLPKTIVYEVVDLKTTAKTLTLKKTFDRLLRMTPALEWTATSWGWNNFMGGSPLTKGFFFQHNKTRILDPITNNFEMKKWWFDGVPIIDSVATKRIVFPGRYSFYKEINNSEGLDITGTRDFEIVIQDDMSGAGGTDSIIHLIFKGWKYL